jgi:signal peptidase II
MVQARVGRLPNLNLGHLAILVLVAVDISSKILAEKFLEFGQLIPMIPSLDLLLVFNSGVAFSMLDFNNAFTSYGLLIIGVMLVGYLYSMLRKEEAQFNQWALILILAGAIGNLLDRSMDGVVTDFLYFHIGDVSFFIFNLADAFISIGAALFFGAEFKKYLHTSNS